VIEHLNACSFAKYARTLKRDLKIVQNCVSLYIFLNISQYCLLTTH